MSDRIPPNMFPDSPDRVFNIILELEEKRDGEAIPSRYPFTYAYDYVRENAEAFGMLPGLSRADVGRAINLTFGLADGARYYSEDHVIVLTSLADAYCAKHGLNAPYELVTETRKALLAPVDKG